MLGNVMLFLAIACFYLWLCDSYKEIEEREEEK